MLIVLLVFASKAFPAAKNTLPRPIVAEGRGGKLTYNPDANGDRIPDFSFAGYKSADSVIPNAAVAVVVPPAAGDNTRRIQLAIDYVGSLPPGPDGLRGAILLQKGRYEVAGGLRISSAGVVLRGSGMGDDGTVLVATGLDRRTLIAITGVKDQRINSSAIDVADKYVPVGATQLKLTDATKLKAGDSVVVNRPCTADWIKALKMVDLAGGQGSGWRPGSRELQWDRTVTAIDGNTITLDVPLTNSLDTAFGGGTVAAYTWPGRISNVGVENLRCESTFDTSNPKDEAHSWIAISCDAVRDAWIRQVTFTHFASSAVAIFETCSRITVEDCKSLAPVSEIGGARRHTFFTEGQQTLFQRCFSEHGRHDFAVGFCATGPNAFVQCEAVDALGDSGAIDSWATGILFDNVRMDGSAISLCNRHYDAMFAGWSGANSVLWQCSSTMFNCFDPPTAHNWCFGAWGMFAGDAGFWDSDNFVQPVSLYYGQLADRHGRDVLERAAMVTRDNVGESRNPTPEEAAHAIAASLHGAPSMGDWADLAPKRTPIPTDAGDAKMYDALGLDRPVMEKPQAPPQTLAVTNGWLTINGKLLTGGRQAIKWWRGGIRPDEVAESMRDGPDLTRYAPGRVGPGLTDDLNQLAQQMQANGRIALDYHYGLWYDIRDIDHERVRRINGDVCPPFYEMPFARSGIGTAWDGLSKYDLTKFNPWYWSRLKQFADICDRRGLVLMNENFFQHNILEAGAHWASSQWRSANNINNTGFPEPPPYSGDKIIYMAEQFYDETHSVRREIFRNYIRKCLDNFADNTNVIQFTSKEFTGPTHFVQFWLDTVAEWEHDTGKKPIIALSAPKDVQDAILADPARAALVSVIDIRYWWYQPKGDLYAPPGGKNLAPRQWMRQLNPKMPTFDQAQRAVKEYRQKFPDKAIIFGPEDGSANFGWAVVMGGGSMPSLGNLNPDLAMAIPTMQPIDVPGAPADESVLADPGHNYLVYCSSNEAPLLNLPAGDGNYSQHWIDPRSGRMTDGSAEVSGQSTSEFKSPGFGPYLFWLKHN